MQQPQLLSGWAKKKGEKGLMKSYKKRYFNQVGTKVEYFTDAGSFSPQGFIDLEAVTKVEKRTIGQFAVHVPGRVYELETVPEGPTLDYWVSGFDSWRVYLAYRSEKLAEKKAAPPPARVERPKSQIMQPIDDKKPFDGLGTSLDKPFEQPTKSPSKSDWDTPSPAPQKQAEPSSRLSQKYDYNSEPQIRPIESYDHSRKGPQKGPDPFWGSIKDDSVNEITSRIRTGAVDANTPFSMSPLHYAIVCGSVNSVKALIQNKANPNQLDSAGQSALLYAIEKQSGQTSADIVDLLLAAGANVHEGDTSDNQFPPLHAACLAANERIVRALLRRGADPMAEDMRLRWSTLHWAAVGGSLAIGQLLVSKGVKIRKIGGVSPTDLAIENQHKMLYNFLVNHKD